jgi:DNA processing protein
MSGLGKASIIVEASETSGTRVLARAAVEHGRAVILTDVVVDATQWGKQLADRPGVYVAGSTSEVMSIVERIVAEDVRLDIAFPLSAVTIRLPDSM